MIKVKMLSALAYADNSTVQPGQIIDLDDEKAKDLIEDNLAVFLCNVVEATEIKPAETIKPEAKPKRRKKQSEE